jgi:medium-chain acyl-[acyl-carrier-protein] hydrolase
LRPGWVEHLGRSNTPSLRVFLFPYAGGTADVYRGWQRWFSEEIDLCLVHLPGRGRSIGEQAFTRLPLLVKWVADRIEPEIKIPYVLYGHSMGALISFELAREVGHRHHRGPQHLLVSGRRAPQWPASEPLTFNLPHDHFIEELRKLNGTPQEVFDTPELLRVFLALLRADFETVETYEYQSGEPLSCPITVYRGIDDAHISEESCSAWQKETSSTCQVRVCNGDHFFVREPGPEFIAAFRSDVLSAVPTPRIQRV